MIAPSVLDEILVFVNAQGGSADVVPKLREQWASIHFTHCLEDELCLEKPVREGDTANVYVVDGSEHCMKITSDPDFATGVLIAELSA